MDAALKWPARVLAAACLRSLAKAELDARELAPSPRSSITAAPGAAAAVVDGLKDALTAGHGADVAELGSALCAVMTCVGIMAGGKGEEAGSGGSGGGSCSGSGGSGGGGSGGGGGSASGGSGGSVSGSGSSFADALVCLGAPTLLRKLLETQAARPGGCARVPVAATLGVLLYH
ncbi:hypothetical protein MNEG_7885 [Monoraphidium neglectum]|uniref:Uncharacterized protein n=1 Tax=Monoraphidium neglectum TaxID=145388 RepID=A0A0D2KXV2_9CHLO|nr:hypothetical protein MNEG_7885 [Monoraphidium neglectum]KIZ00079.1 hypothetical protein MNEG_7885 [Monoraphidium neglectum]|eukprot:XP_013899098.1 hypothetical protein MNEG_7885 [Monoraphidium neglectum]